MGASSKFFFEELHMVKNSFLSALLLFTVAGYSGVASAEVSMTVLVTGANR